MIKNEQINIAKLIYQPTTAPKSEKRRHFRLSLRLPMEYSFPESSRHRLAYTADICEGGLSMHTPEKLEIGQDLNVKFYYDSVSGLDWVQGFGEVIRADRLGNSGEEYWYAVRFVDLSSDILKKLREFLKSLY
jgi:c-di-GMP-binding flagellar brake protein YcgR